MSRTTIEDLDLQLVDIEHSVVASDRKFLLDVVIALGELHGRVCDEIGRCGDMDKASVLGDELKGISEASNKINEFADEAKDFANGM